MLRELAAFRPLSLVPDGVPRRSGAMPVAVANGRLGIFPRVQAGLHTSHPAVQIERVRRVRLEAAGVAAYADGEAVGRLPLSVDVAPGALCAAV
ncbi:hypothetical protein [Arthrobacter sp.]|uniref:hypothetical protein n=1 Tax=Arthrobacter sp. TaxID=1667 RepID=UPI003395FC1C